MAKCYVREPESDLVRDLVWEATAVLSSSIVLAEVPCVLHRGVREKSLSAIAAQRLLDAFMADAREGRFSLIPITAGILDEVVSIVRRLPPESFLRAGDAIHLASARSAGVAEIWSNDRHLLSAAHHFGLKGRSVSI